MRKPAENFVGLFFILLPLLLSSLSAHADQVVIHNLPDHYSFGVDNFGQEQPKPITTSSGTGILVSVFSDLSIQPQVGLQVVADKQPFGGTLFETLPNPVRLLDIINRNPMDYNDESYQVVFLVDFSVRSFCATRSGLWEIHFTAMHDYTPYILPPGPPITTLDFLQGFGVATVSRWIAC